MQAYSKQNDQELTGATPLYTITGDLDATHSTQIGPIITPQTDIATYLGDGAPLGLTTKSLLTALLIAAAVIFGAGVVLKTQGIKF